MGSGIPRARREWPDITLYSESSSNQFVAAIQRINSGIIEYTESTETSQLPELTSRLESNLATRLLILLANEEHDKREMAVRLNHKSVSGELHK